MFNSKKKRIEELERQINQLYHLYNEPHRVTIYNQLTDWNWSTDLNCGSYPNPKITIEMDKAVELLYEHLNLGVVRIPSKEETFKIKKNN